RHLALTPTPSTASYTLSLHDALPILNVAESLTISTISDTAICGGQASVELTTTAVQGATYKWTPATGLSNPNIANPVASPTSTTNYIVTVTSASSCTGTGALTLKVHD